jgi:RNA polymerase sigma-70 factor (ECF subfamily)
VDQRGLVERAKRGDHDAFAVLAGAAASRLLAAARLILRDPELARDATQDALVRAWRDLPSLRDPDRFDAWLHRLTVNACLDSARRRRRRPIEVEIGDFAEQPSSSADHAGAVADRELLDQALRRLGPDGRAVIVLHYYLGLPLSEVAATLRIPAGTAKSRLNRSLELMRGLVSVGSDAAADVAREGQPA